MLNDLIKYGGKYLIKKTINSNMNNNLKKYKPLDILKYTFSIGFSMVFVVILYKIIRANENKRIAKKLVDNIEVKINNLTYNLSKYYEFADTLYYSMKGLGTSEENIKRTIQQLKTKDDWNMLIKAFGLRKGENLLLWLEDDLDSYEYKYIMDYVNNVLI